MLLSGSADDQLAKFWYEFRLWGNCIQKCSELDVEGVYRADVGALGRRALQARLLDERAAVRIGPLDLRIDPAAGVTPSMAISAGDWAERSSSSSLSTPSMPCRPPYTVPICGNLIR